MQSLPLHTALEQANKTPRTLVKRPNPQLANRLLSCLRNGELEQLLHVSERVSLRPRQVIQERNLPLRHAYFLESGIASLQTWRGQGQTVEVRTIGRNDMVGLPIVLGPGRSPRRCVVQIGGSALRVPAGELASFVEKYPHARAVFLAYTHAAIGQTAQMLACNTCHSVHERVSRWLLAIADQLDSTDLAVTHSCIARSLGVRRASVTNVAGSMEKQNLVRQARGIISLVDRAEIERQSCGCYRVIRDAYQRMPFNSDATSSAYANRPMAA